MYCVALTGSIASGKSTVAALFEKHGVTVIYSDVLARSLTRPDSPHLQVIAQHFAPNTVLLPSGALDRKKLRSIIFKDPKEKAWLESFLHPLIRKQIKREVFKVKSAYVIVEIPLLYSLDNYPYIKRVLVVDAPDGLKISRIIQRDNCSKKQAETILQSQPSIETRLNIADDILLNDGELSVLAVSVDKLHKQYLKLSAA